MNATNFEAGTPVDVLGFYGENGDKAHAATGKIEVENGQNVLVLFAAYACDGDLMHSGNGGYYRGNGGIVCASDAADRTALLDAAITCEACRRKLNLSPIAKSAAATATVAARKAAAAAARLAAKNTSRAAEIRGYIAAAKVNAEADAAYIATPDAELVAAIVADFDAKYGPYPADAIARMNADPRTFANVAEKKARKAAGIKGLPNWLRKQEAILEKLGV